MKKDLEISFLLSIMIVISLIESFIPIVNGVIPGLKLGLANIVVLFVLYRFSFKEVLFISVVRVFVMGLLRTGLFSVTFFFAFFGSIFSVIMMYLFKKTNKFSIVGISIIGSVFHGFGQILVASLLLKNPTIISYLPFVILFSIPTGLIVGLIGKEFVKSLEID